MLLKIAKLQRISQSKNTINYPKKVTEFTSDTEQENLTRDRKADVINCLEVLFKGRKILYIIFESKISFITFNELEKSGGSQKPSQLEKRSQS